MCVLVQFILKRNYKTFFLPFDTGGVTEITGLGATGESVEGPTESSVVCGFPAPLAHGLGDCEGLRKKKRVTV